MKQKPFDKHFEKPIAKKIRNKELGKYMTDNDRKDCYISINKHLDAARSNLENAVILAFESIGVNPNEGGIDQTVANMARGPHLFANDMYLFAHQVAMQCRDW